MTSNGHSPLVPPIRHNHVWNYTDVIILPKKRFAYCDSCPAIWYAGKVYMPNGEEIDEKIVREYTMRTSRAIDFR